jgi:hypothetical protein
MKALCALVGSCVLLTLAGSAAAGGGFPWRERASTYGHLSVSFTVDRISVGPRGWSAGVTMRNWDIALRLDEDVALVVDGGRALPATRFEPALRRVFPVRGSWRGILGGPQLPPHGSVVRLRLGTFRAVMAPNLVLRHVTRHAYRVP